MGQPFKSPNIGLIEAAAREAGELTYLETTMLPFVESLIPAAAI
jgi:hypothetical protein